MPRRQRTLARSFRLSGVGLHTGAETTVEVHPGAAGLRFLRRDRPGSVPIPARYDLVTAASYGTTLQTPEGGEAHTVEHLLSALYGAGIDHAEIHMTGPEVPIMDGSAEPFAAAIADAGIAELAAPQAELIITGPVAVSGPDGKLASFEPADGFEIACSISFTDPAIGDQDLALRVTPESFRAEIAPARTFTFARDIEMLRAAGLIKGGSLDNAVVVQDGKILNAEGLRFANECVRHKILDVTGDLALAGMPIRGRFTGHKMGHALNNALLRALFARNDCFRIAV